LAAARDVRCRRSVAEITAELTGRWRDDHHSSLQQAATMYDAIPASIADYEQEIRCQLTSAGARRSAESPGVPPDHPE
jgi:hypothetical protein